ncbi:hypothetical protein, partial [Streptomyces sp. AB3(2024)]|uniref:hypothetical protein n=1 Tax=Streptomyces sp. AB3(2024) TaxID=3317321 RepID=UPI0035A31240
MRHNPHRARSAPPPARTRSHCPHTGHGKLTRASPSSPRPNRYAAPRAGAEHDPPDAGGDGPPDLALRLVVA